MKMALSDELLMKVEQPARYLGNEVNAANKDKSKQKEEKETQKEKSYVFSGCLRDWYVSSWNPDSI